MNLTVEARHMDVTDAIRDYAESKASKLTRYDDSIQTIEVILDVDAGKAVAEIVVSAARKSTFVATHRGDDLYGCIDQALDKVVHQLRRHKEKMRDHKNPSTKDALGGGL